MTCVVKWGPYLAADHYLGNYSDTPSSRGTKIYIDEKNNFAVCVAGRYYNQEKLRRIGMLLFNRSIFMAHELKHPKKHVEFTLEGERGILFKLLDANDTVYIMFKHKGVVQTNIFKLPNPIRPIHQFDETEFHATGTGSGSAMGSYILQRRLGTMDFDKLYKDVAYADATITETYDLVDGLDFNEVTKEDVQQYYYEVFYTQGEK